MSSYPDLYKISLKTATAFLEYLDSKMKHLLLRIISSDKKWSLYHNAKHRWVVCCLAEFAPSKSIKKKLADNLTTAK